MNANSSPTRVDKWLEQAAAKLSVAGIGSARLDCLILLEDVTGRNRAWLLAHPELELKASELNRLNKQLARRAAHEPLAYIRGFTEFYGRRFKVNHRVLEPRPESETMIELLKKLTLPHDAKIADVGTGSGCLGITAALELPGSHVDLFDIDASAVAVARHNAEMHELHLRIEKRDLLRSSHTEYDAVLANLPYVPDHFTINPAAAREPKIAIFGGKDGLSVYRRLFEQVQGFKHPPHFILTEALPPQHHELSEVALKSGYRLNRTQDFIQIFKLTGS